MAPSQAATFVNSSSSLELHSFSHQLQDSAVFSSAFGLISNGEQTFVGTSDPQFVTGPSLIFHPDGTNLPVVKQLLSDGVTTFLPLNLDFIQGQITGTSQVILTDHQKLSANLISQLQYKLAEDLPFVSSTVAQSGWQMSFLLEENEVFSYQFTSLIKAQFTSNFLSRKERIVIYFYTLPRGIELVNPILSFSLAPEPMISANSPLLNVGLLVINQESGSLKILGNSRPYFQIEQISNQQVQGTFEYLAHQSTTLNLVAYTSSSFTSVNSPILVSEPDFRGLGIVLCFLIIIKRKN